MATLVLLLIILSEPATERLALGLDLAMIAAVIVANRVRFRDVFRRIVWASPFILAAAAMYPLSQSGSGTPAPELWGRAFGLALKAYAAVLAASLLALTDRLDRLLGAFRSLGFPPALSSIALLAGRYLHVLGDEAARMKRARAGRTPGRPRVSRVRDLGATGAALFIRARKRSAAVQMAMEARGFDGSFPDPHPSALRPRDALALVFLLPFAAVRIFRP